MIWDKIIEFLIQEWPIAIWILLGGSLTWATLHILGKVKQTSDKTEHITDRLNQLPCDAHQTKLDDHQTKHYDLKQDVTEKHASLNNNVTQINTSIAYMKESIDTVTEKYASLNSNVTQINTSISYMKESIDTIRQSLQNNNGIIVNPFAERHSPMSLTQEGLELVKKIGMEKMVDSNWDKIRQYIRENMPATNPYDIQQFLMEHVAVFPNRFITDENVLWLKTFAYANGIPLMSYLTVIAILIRDKYFLDQDIHIEDIDKYVPQLA
ncbi:MAG: hypothetical protein LBQ73_10895 [Tannerellaceae bacterium]|jgi:septation ring formation regulator EzrA|nr:hypothetical protein [Tannerellaceae bacterium]